MQLPLTAPIRRWARMFALLEGIFHPSSSFCLSTAGMQVHRLCDVVDLVIYQLAVAIADMHREWTVPCHVGQSPEFLPGCHTDQPGRLGDISGRHQIDGLPRRNGHVPDFEFDHRGSDVSSELRRRFGFARHHWNIGWLLVVSRWSVQCQRDGRYSFQHRVTYRVGHSHTCGKHGLGTGWPDGQVRLGWKDRFRDHGVRSGK